MAFNFLGKIASIEEFEEFEEFVTIEADNLTTRIEHLQKEKSRYYEVLDRFKIADLKLRADYTKSDQPDANWIQAPRPVIQGNTTKNDALNAVDVDSLKRMFIDVIKFKRERNEFKVKRIRDLIEQFDNEISFLSEQKDNYLDILSKIRSRFDLKDFSEIQKTDFLDPADVQTGIKVIEKDAGREVAGTTITYYILNISSNKKTLSFENIAPPVKTGDKLVLSNGKNNGIKTVTNIINSRTIEVFEDLIDENPATTMVTKQ